jgi:hypothetical protein
MSFECRSHRARDRRYVRCHPRLGDYEAGMILVDIASVASHNVVFGSGSGLKVESGLMR